MQSRIDTVAEHVAKRACVGNLYINRNQIGAVVESQPFGGEGLSGTGPKAGGPHYVARFATERVTCIDTTAAGGNATLMAAID
ncbi:aldehyde dehydrogenase family protein [Sphingomonas glaciei]|uniref:Aldehyde dehydrogenase family protein n=1 Tax=Sphingomonas glaciei TaxID=2938948 RepID=A0ABY5MY52_9SPHN|nr:aldehyde dehydrogenase family protein [Sphingomonas glaciei]UUR09384.1 aldehyde dehydrogenase family protein [Sphingomonas glaciei]